MAYAIITFHPRPHERKLVTINLRISLSYIKEPSFLVQPPKLQASHNPFCHHSPKSIKRWCNQTPCPKPCEHSMSQLPFPSSSLKQRSEFYKLTVEVALDQAILAYTHTKSLGDKCRNKQEREGWTECLEHYENTIIQLNSTPDPLGECTTFNKQTWLSKGV